MCVQVVGDRPAAAGTGCRHQRHAQPIEHPGRGGIDAWRERRLHAALQQQHAPHMPGGGARPGGTGRRYAFGEGGRQQRSERPRRLQQRTEQAGTRQDGAQRQAQHPVMAGAWHLLLDHGAADVGEPAVAHAGRAGRLARTAGEAAVQVLARLHRGRAAFEYLLHQVDAAAWPVQFVADQLVGRAGRGAEAAVHAGTQDRLGLPALGGVADEIGQACLHGQSPG